jgi:hypothetical protein
MADIIESRLKSSVSLMREFKKIARCINDEHTDNLLSPVTITLGDEFQAVARSPRDGVQAIIAFEEMIIHKKVDFKIRYLLHSGEIETPINREAAYGMLGSGLTEARKLLAEMKRSKQRFRFSLGEEIVSEKMNLAFILYQSIVDGWKPRDFYILAEFLKENDYKLVAKKLRKDASLIWRRKKSLKLNDYAALKRLIEIIGC